MSAMTIDDVAVLLGLLAVTLLVTAVVSWRTDARRDAWLITGVGSGMAAMAAVLGVLEVA